jgi:predicted DNA-binding transcriptional regulator YafY
LPVRLHAPNIEAFATISRAIYSKRVVSITYISENGPSIREIVPFSFAGNGLRWHVRAFDRKRSIFADFVINRIKNAELVAESKIQAHETRENDHQWNRMVDLEITPHPDIKARGKSTEFIEYEHKMTDGMLTYKVRASLAGYILRLWNVDCTPEATMPTNRQLWLRNPQALYGVSSAKLAPGYIQSEGANKLQTDI